uniref:Uncharacterized protein n=1 Tax=Oryza punctata TaxID=4537 RepID=A0A0E0K257_ORYPU
MTVVDLVGDLSCSVAYAAASWLWTGGDRPPPSSGRSCLAASTVAARAAHCSATAISKRKTKTDACGDVVRAAADSIAQHAQSNATNCSS